MNDRKPTDVIRMTLPTLSPRLQVVGRLVMRDPFRVVTSSMRDIAEENGVSPATFTRFARAVGFSGWEELRQALVAEERGNAQAPFSSRIDNQYDRSDAGYYRTIIASALENDIQVIGKAKPAEIEIAADLVAQSNRVWICGYRSCRSVATMLYYQLRLFRSDDIRLVGSDVPPDVDFGAFRAGDVMILITFSPYSRIMQDTAEAARKAGCTIIAIIDSETAPVGEGATSVLLFQPMGDEGFFPSLTGAFAISHALVAATFRMGGDRYLANLKQTERWLAEARAFSSRKPRGKSPG